MSKPGAYLKLDGNGAWWAILKTSERRCKAVRLSACRTSNATPQRTF
jgi:hypothetical protein